MRTPHAQRFSVSAQALGVSERNGWWRESPHAFAGNFLASDDADVIQYA
jgi:hypothetical protein